jgi:hypothetical protein
VLAVDTVASYFIGFSPETKPYLKLSSENGLGEYQLENIRVEGADHGAIQMGFVSPFPKN